MSVGNPDQALPKFQNRFKLSSYKHPKCLSVSKGTPIPTPQCRIVSHYARRVTLATVGQSTLHCKTWTHYCAGPAEFCPISRLPDEIQRLVIDETPPIDRVSLQQANPHMKWLMSDRATYRVKDLLASFDLDANAFLEGLEYSGAIIGGMAALHVFDISVPTPRILEVYCDGLPYPGTAPPDEQLFDQSHEGGPESKYRLEEVATLPTRIRAMLGYEFYGERVEQVRRMVHKTSDREILFVVSKVSPVALITEAPTTLLMNFIAANEVVSLYPDLLERKIGLLTIPVPEDGETLTSPVPALDRLVGLKFSLVQNVDEVLGGHVCGQNPSCPEIVREYPGHGLYSIPLLRRCTWGTCVAGTTWKLRVASSCGDLANSSRRGWHIHRGEVCLGAYMQSHVGSRATKEKPLPV
ncbi:hypothetical protein D9611_002431 [Ephemerocybe angulata]|uniref:F-box domain-containing protein n=1 Tax=Ephemerocybe angulata TaxID=980116 RepID=A0A8H5C0R8_9AGAR|nr:hypothetical protein D9611_002431 [Tulosesus angulatus]